MYSTDLNKAIIDAEQIKRKLIEAYQLESINKKKEATASLFLARKLMLDCLTILDQELKRPS